MPKIEFFHRHQDVEDIDNETIPIPNPLPELPGGMKRKNPVREPSTIGFLTGFLITI